MLTLRVNGKVHHVDVDPDTPLLWVLNEQLGLMGTKYSCGIGECGACTVYVDGENTLSCITPAGDVEGMEITTIEGLKGPVADAIRQAWIEEDVPQCGYCQPGQIMAAAALLNSNPNPNDDDIDAAMSDILCRCGTYQAIRRGIHCAAKRYNHEKK
ncbi:MAG: (2Fe-2S)-binding protein [Candidatus Aminicenantes bacterium]|nr:(2Fe-2S)-binding protein [Candidatus Aminicenantes bacterium]